MAFINFHCVLFNTLNVSPCPKYRGSGFSESRFQASFAYVNKSWPNEANLLWFLPWNCEKVTKNADIHASVFPLLRIYTSQSLDPQILAPCRQCRVQFEGSGISCMKFHTAKSPLKSSCMADECDLVLAAATSDRGTSWNSQENYTGPSCNSCKLRLAGIELSCLWSITTASACFSLNVFRGQRLLFFFICDA